MKRTIVLFTVFMILTSCSRAETQTELNVERTLEHIEHIREMINTPPLTSADILDLAGSFITYEKAKLVREQLDHLQKQSLSELEAAERFVRKHEFEKSVEHFTLAMNVYEEYRVLAKAVLDLTIRHGEQELKRLEQLLRKNEHRI